MSDVTKINKSHKRFITSATEKRTFPKEQISIDIKEVYYQGYEVVLHVH